MTASAERIPSEYRGGIRVEVKVPSGSKTLERELSEAVTDHFGQPEATGLIWFPSYTHVQGFWRRVRREMDGVTVEIILE